MKRKASKNALAWNTATTMDVPAVITAYEKELRLLNLTNAPIKELIKSEALHQWVLKNRNDRYVPEQLLRAFGLTTIWDTEQQSQKSKAVVSKSNEEAYKTAYEKTYLDTQEEEEQYVSQAETS